MSISMRWIKGFACCMLACGLAFQGWGQMELLPVNSNDNSFGILNGPNWENTQPLQEPSFFSTGLADYSSGLFSILNGDGSGLDLESLPFILGLQGDQIFQEGGYGDLELDLVFQFFGYSPDVVVPESSSFAMVAGGLTLFLAVLPLNPARKLKRLLRLGILAFR